MQFNSFSEFISMGGYGFYVWLSFGLAALLLIILFISSKLGFNKVKAQIIQKQKRENKLKLAAEQQRQSIQTEQNENTNDTKEVLS